MTEYNVGDRLKFRGNLWSILKTKPGKVLLKGYGYKKWFDIDEIEREKQHENETF